jgi:type IV pilus assembly protein PilY1
VNELGKIGPPDWHASTLAADKRRIFTLNSDGKTTSFEWSKLDSTRQGQLDPAKDNLGDKRVLWLRGDRNQELSNKGPFRDRNPATVIGDIISSSPVFVGAPRAPYSDAIATKKYSAFKTKWAGRQKMIYTGANDGMLHAFDAQTGQEVWAYIPSSVFPNLQELTKPNYVHRYFVDGPANAVDAVVNGEWATVLAGGLNNGGQGVYALNVTDPVAASADDAAKYLLWEFTDADDVDLGVTYSRPAIVKMGDGKWYAVFGNGYNNTTADGNVSTTGEGVLYAVQLENKSIRYKFKTGVGSTATPNGLSSPAVVDFDDDGTADYAYVGDLRGNLWKFQFAGADPTKWGFAFKTAAGTPSPLFVATDSTGLAQPITTRPQVGFGRRGEGMMVLFGTGKFLEEADRNVALIKPQTFYGIWDRNNPTDTASVAVSKVARADLQPQTVDAQQSVTIDSITTNVRVTSQNDVGAKMGWYLDLPSTGEIQVTNSALRNRRVIFTSQVPSSDPCSGGGTSWLMELDYMSGARLTDPAFDLNGDDKFTAADLFKVTINGKDYMVSASAVQSDTGIWSQPAFLTSGQDEFLYMSTSNNNDRENKGCNDGTMDCKKNGVPPTAYGRQSWRQVK